MAEVNTFATIVANARAYYRLEGNANDSSPNGNNATAVGTPTFSSGNGKFGQGVGLNGSSQYISAPNASIIWSGSGSNLTLALWFRIDSGDTAFGLIGCEDSTTPTQGLSLSYGVKTAGKFCFRKPGTAAAQIEYTWTPDALWHHIAVTNNGTTAGATDEKMYFDGVEVVSGQATSSLSNVAFGPIVAIGALQQGTSTNITNHFSGAIDDVLSTDQILTAGDILSLATTSSLALAKLNINQAIKRASLY